MSDDNKPLDNVEVETKVTPKHPGDNSHRDEAKKIEKVLQGEVKKAIADNASGGHAKQLAAAKKAVKQARDALPPQKVEKAEVTVKGKDGDGDQIEQKISVKPEPPKPKP